jgi:hypothetical protein
MRCAAYCDSGAGERGHKHKGPETLSQVLDRSLACSLGTIIPIWTPKVKRQGVGYEGKEELGMEINFRHDVDQVLKDAKTQQKPVLLDFSAAPM